MKSRQEYGTNVFYGRAFKKPGKAVSWEDPSRGWVSCDQCGERWCVNTPANGARHPRGTWLCPNGCNSRSH